jgi:hypothetical protein
MISTLLLDLGGTLMVQDTVLPGVPEALREFQSFETAGGKPLIMCLVSDYTMPEPRTPQAIEAVFKEYLAILDGAKLREFFEPVDERVTLSTHAGVWKPNSLVFETALIRAKVNATIRDALFITEDGEHVKACRNLGMTVLQFGKDFHDWASAPLLVAQTIAPSSPKNLDVALKPLLSEKYDVKLESIDSISEGAVCGQGRSWVKLDASELGSLDGVHVELPVNVAAKIMPSGRLDDVRVAPNPDEVAEAVQNVHSLASNKQVEEPDGVGNSPVLPTHIIEIDSEGRRLLRRRCFTAW